MSMDNDILEVLLTKEEIDRICKRLGEQISKDYENKNLLIVSVLKGAVVFMTDVMRYVTCKCKIDFMAVSSYSGTKTTGSVRFKKDLDIDPDGYDILVLEDILDTGLTLSYIINILKTKKAKSVKICTFLDKPAHRASDVKADYVGIEIADQFVVGYGLDYNEEYRNLPYLGVLKPEVYGE